MPYSRPRLRTSELKTSHPSKLGKQLHPSSSDTNVMDESDETLSVRLSLERQGWRLDVEGPQ